MGWYWIVLNGISYCLSSIFDRRPWRIVRSIFVSSLLHPSFSLLILVPLAHTVGFMRPGCHEPTWQQRSRSDRIPILSIDNRQIFKNGLPLVHFSGGERIHKLRVGILGWIPCRGRWGELSHTAQGQLASLQSGVYILHFTYSRADERGGQG